MALDGRGLPTTPQLNPHEQFIVNQQGPAVGPRDSIPFYITNLAGGVTVAGAGTLTTVLTHTIQEGQTGYLKFVGLSVEPAMNFGDIQWQLCVNNSAVSNFGNNGGVNSFLTVAVNTLAQLFPCQVTLRPKDTISLKAINSGLGDVTCFATIQGWTYPIKRV